MNNRMINKSRPVIGVIPARYASTRFRGKILADICGKPMIQWVYERASQSKTLDQLIVAVDDKQVKSVVQGFGGKAILTGMYHQTGTDRISEAVKKIRAAIVVNIQGDQPLIEPEMIDEAVLPLIENPDIGMSTLKREINPDEFNDPDVVKVVVDDQGFALYFSRSLIPYPRYDDDLKVYEHVGLYAYRKDFLQIFSGLPQGHLERIESLEQLRALEKGYKILVVETKADRNAGISVDSPEDIEKVRKLIESIKQE